MSYDNPIYQTTTIDFTANQVDASWKIKGPKGLRGRVIDQMYTPTATTATTGACTVNVGTGALATAFSALSIANGLTAGTNKRASNDGTVTTTISAADTDVIVALTTFADTDDIQGTYTLTMAWW